MMEAMKGDICDICWREIQDTKGTFRDHIFSICSECIKRDEDDKKMKEKQNDR